MDQREGGETHSENHDASPFSKSIETTTRKMLRRVR
jgi:hypothetical protein